MKNIKNHAWKRKSLIHSSIGFENMENAVDAELTYTRIELIVFAKNIFNGFKENNGHKDLIFNSGENELYIETDSNKLDSIISNILSNACKYTDNGWTIILSINANKCNEVELSISDTGVGIPNNELSLIFQ